MACKPASLHHPAEGRQGDAHVESIISAPRLRAATAKAGSAAICAAMFLALGFAGAPTTAQADQADKVTSGQLEPTTTALATAQAPAAPGAPAADPLRAIAEADIRDALLDPDSAKFKWTGTFIPRASFQPTIFSPTYTGNLQVGCGRVNSRNRMGGMVGFTWFWVLIKDGVAIQHNIDAADADLPMAQAVCAQLGY